VAASLDPEDGDSDAYRILLVVAGAGCGGIVVMVLGVLALRSTRCKGNTVHVGSKDANCIQVKVAPLQNSGGSKDSSTPMDQRQHEALKASWNSLHQKQQQALEPLNSIDRFRARHAIEEIEKQYGVEESVGQGQTMEFRRPSHHSPEFSSEGSLTMADKVAIELAAPGKHEYVGPQGNMSSRLEHVAVVKRDHIALEAAAEAVWCFAGEAAAAAHQNRVAAKAAAKVRLAAMAAAEERLSSSSHGRFRLAAMAAAEEQRNPPEELLT